MARLGRLVAESPSTLEARAEAARCRMRARALMPPPMSGRRGCVVCGRPWSLQVLPVPYSDVCRTCGQTVIETAEVPPFALTADDKRLLQALKIAQW